MAEHAAGTIDYFDHVTIVVRDVDASALRYSQLLGKPPTWRGGHPELGSRAVIFGLGNGLIELVGPSAGDARDEGLRALLDTKGEGLHAIAFGTEDAAACSALLKGRGVRATPPEEGEAFADEGGPSRRYRTVEISPRASRGVGVLVVEREDLNDLQATHVPLSAAVDALDHIVINTSDPDAATAFYGEGLGVRLALDRDMRGTRMLFFRVGGVTVEVVGRADAGAEDSFYGLAYRVGDIDAAHARLLQADFELGEIREGNKPGTRVFTVRGDTCGVPTLIIRDPARDR